MPRPKFLTPSSFGKLMTNGRTKDKLFGDTAMSVIYQLALDLLEVEQPEEEYIPDACLWGIENEYLAKRAYELKNMVTVRTADFKVSPTLDYVGGTMDGLVGSRGGIEVKCPFNSVNHLDIHKQYSGYEHQITGYMWVYELEWIDFVSFDPRFPAPLQLRSFRIERNESAIAILEQRCREAHAMALQYVEQLQEEAVGVC